MSVYRQVMGHRFEALGPAVREFHSARGMHRYSGQVMIDGAASRLGRLIAWLGRLPSTARRTRFSFTIDATPARETWTRHFPLRTMQSVLTPDGSELVEKLGIFRLRFVLQDVNGRLRMDLRRVIAFGVPCPRWLFPNVFAEERGEGGRFHFDIRVSMPLAGQVVRYSGYLELPSHEAPA